VGQIHNTVPYLPHLMLYWSCF